MTRMRTATVVLGASVLAAATLMTWWAWLGWESGYRYDPATQTYSGPYAAWQIVGCALTFMAVAVGVALVLPPWLVASVMPLSFTGAWSAHAATADDSGMWPVGAVLVLGGTAIGATILAYVTVLTRNVLRRSRSVASG